MFNSKGKIPKSQLPAPSKYDEYYYHQTPKTERKWNENFIMVTSVDPATKNFAIRIEKWNADGTIIPLVFTKTNLSENEEISPYVSLLNFLEKYKEFLLKTHVFVVEKQVPQNYKCVRISQHTITYFMTITKDNPNLPSIYEVSPKLKGEYLGAPKKISEKDLKLWAVNKAIEICKQRNDKYSLEIIEKTKKKDDLSDTIVQTEALFGHIGIAVLTENINKGINLEVLNVKQPDLVLVDTVKIPIIKLKIKV